MLPRWIFCLLLLFIGSAARAGASTEADWIEVGLNQDPPAPAPGEAVQIYVDPALEFRRGQGITGPVDAVLTVSEGIGIGALSYVLWIFLHEGSHAAMVEAIGGDVTRFDWLPSRRDDGSIVFAQTYMVAPEGRDFTPGESVAIDLAPNMSAFVGAAVGAALWATGALPDNRHARIPFTAFQVGAAINLGIMFTLSRSKDSDAIDAMRTLGLDQGDQKLVKAGMLTLSVLALVPAADGLVHAVSGLTLFPHRGSREGDGHGVRLIPLVGPDFAGITARF